MWETEIAEINLEKYYGKGKSGLVEREEDFNNFLLQLTTIVNALVQRMNKLGRREWEAERKASGKDVVYKGKYKGAKL